MMYSVTIHSIGKTKEAWLQLALAEYEKRLKPHMHITWSLGKEDKDLKSLLGGVESYICLDPKGKLFSSVEFSSFLLETLTKRGGKADFVIGGDVGIPQELYKKGLPLLSLSPLTFTHQMTRLILLEQIYRAIQISIGSAYHK